jgi:hypothetical protein
VIVGLAPGVPAAVTVNWVRRIAPLTAEMPFPAAPEVPQPVDDEIAFVTSANFTEWAQERNLEAGVLVRDVGFARSLRNQFESLIAASGLRLLPGSAD